MIVLLEKERYADLVSKENKMAPFALTALLARRIINNLKTQIIAINDEDIITFITESEFSPNNKKYLQDRLKRYLYELSVYDKVS